MYSAFKNGWLIDSGQLLRIAQVISFLKQILCKKKLDVKCCIVESNRMFILVDCYHQVLPVHTRGQSSIIFGQRNKNMRFSNVLKIA